MKEIEQESDSPVAAKGKAPGSFRRAGRPWIVWMALIGFILGVALCSFNPIDIRQGLFQSPKEKETMNALSSSAASNIENRTTASAIPGAFETATFSMG